MRWPAYFLVAGLTAAAGCRSASKDLVEAELRGRDSDLRVLRSELERTEAYNNYLQRELNHVQHSVAGSSPVEDGGPPPPTALRSIVLGRQTGGFEEDGIPGDEALQVVLEPRDCDNHTVKVPGTAQITALEIMPKGTKRPLCSWQVSAEELRRHWQSGLLTTGYFLVLPWKNWPASPKLRVVVQFIGNDQRLYEADRDVTVRIVPALYRKPMPPAEDAPPPPPLPRPAETPPTPREDSLPPPRKVEPEKKEPEKKDQNPAGPPLPALPEKPASLLDGIELLQPIARQD
jgi:hypothetical protein